MSNERNNSVEQVLPVKRSTPAVDIYETDTELILLAELPGVDEQDLQLEVIRGILTLDAPRQKSAGGSSGSYYRQFKLPDHFDGDAGQAVLADGLLTLRLPKSAAAQPKKIAVNTLH